MRVADHSYDLAPARQFRRDLAAFAYRILTWPVASGQFIIDDHRIRRLRIVSFGELPALEKPNTHRMKVVGGNRTVIRSRLLTGRHELSLHRENHRGKSRD